MLQNYTKNSGRSGKDPVSIFMYRHFKHLKLVISQKHRIHARMHADAVGLVSS